MDLSKMPLFSLVAQRMGWLSERQRVLAENIANADTPRYHAHDLAPQSFKEMMGNVPSSNLTTTNAKHLSSASGASSADVTTPKSHRKLLSGNTVSLNKEMMKISETANDFSLVTSLYRKQIGMLRSVLTRP